MEKDTIKNRTVKHSKRIVAIVLLLLVPLFVALFARTVYLRV